MRVAVIGAGHIGGTIGEKWKAAGHDVVYGLRDPSKQDGAKSIGAALNGADAVLLAVPGGAVKQLVDDHAEELDGKVVIDATNSFGGPSANQWRDLGNAVPNAALFRVFNSYGFEVSAKPTFGGVQADMFYAGPEGGPQDTVEKLIRDVGFNPVWVGGVDAADTVDGVLRLWFALTRRHGRRIAFKLLKD